ncbi:beta strand repeat-containing protein [Paucilactobacillus hokkaidonensis]|uniref:beta strand repeat-containing protein n=1 Tax=Paucilactobacillus hokkaidonensis TaxID=1193095 RepID=UPI0023B79E63|nr:MBG domain-containing protein [Paucilactobacillus hokkaidonensis]
MTATVSGTRVYDGLDGQDNGATSEQDDYKNLTFVLTDSKGNVLDSNIDASDVANTGIYYESADAGKYPATVSINGKNLADLKTANPQYNFLSISTGDYTITAAPVTATITSDNTVTKVYDGTAVPGYVPSVVFARTDGGTLIPNEGTNSLDQIAAWTAADFTYSLNGTTVANPTDVGTYTIEFSDAGLAKLAAATNFAVTPVYLGTYTITAAQATATLSTPSFTYDGTTKASDETGLFATVNVLAGTGDDGGSTVKVALTSDDVSFTTDGTDAVSYGYSLTDAGLITVQNAVKNYTLTKDDVTGGSVAIDKANATITVDDGTFGYDGTSHSIPDGNVTVTGAVSDDQLAYNLTNNARTDAGSQTVGIELTAGSLVNSNYNITTTDTAQLTITPASTTGNENASVKTDNQSITYGDATPTLSVTVGSDLTTTDAGLTNADYTIANAQYTNDGKYLAAGSYTVTLNASGIAKLEAVNPNYKIDAVQTGTITVAPKQIKVTAGSDSKVYGTSDPTLDSNYDHSQLVGNDDQLDYAVSRAAGEDVGSYFETITVGDNANYAIVPVAGRFTITPKGTNPGDVNTTVTVNNASSSYGESAPDFSITVGSDLNNPGNLTNADFTFTNKATGEVVAGVPTNVGNYDVSLNDSGKAKVAVANPNYKFNDDSFISGTYTINDVITHSEITRTRTIHYTGAGVRTPGDVEQTITYDVATSKATGESVYTPLTGYAAVNTPAIAGFTNSGNVAAWLPATATTKPNNSTVNVTYTPTNDIEYSEITVTRTIHYVGAGNQTPHDVIEKVVYKVVTNKTTGEVSYTPQGVYDAVVTPDVAGYTNSGDVAELVPSATMTQPEDSTVVVNYQAVSQPGDGESGNETNPTNPGKGNNDNGNSSNGVGDNNSVAPTNENNGANVSNISNVKVVGNKTNTNRTALIHANKEKLPQTNDNNDKTGAIAGLSLLGLTLGMFGFKRRKRDEN